VSRQHSSTSLRAFRLLPTLLLSLAACASAPRALPNLSELKWELRTYHDSGRYLADITTVVERAAALLERRAGQVDRPAMVLDVDETALSSWPNQDRRDFGYVRAEWLAWVETAEAPAIAPTLELYRRARELGVQVFFITGRRERLRDPTEKNLRSAGYQGWTELVMKPDQTRLKSAAEYKTPARRRLTEQDYTILVNIGDQPSDLEGGYAEQTFLLPNPFYRVR
jgi:acid phosphatase